MWCDVSTVSWSTELLHVRPRQVEASVEANGRYLSLKTCCWLHICSVCVQVSVWGGGGYDVLSAMCSLFDFQDFRSSSCSTQRGDRGRVQHGGVGNAFDSSNQKQAAVTTLHTLRSSSRSQQRKTTWETFLFYFVAFLRHHAEIRRLWVQTSIIRMIVLEAKNRNYWHVSERQQAGRHEVETWQVTPGLLVTFQLHVFILQEPIQRL